MPSKETRSQAQAPERPFRPGPEYLIALVLSWALPGAGHWVLGYRKRAAILGGLILLSFWFGEVASGGYAVNRKEHPIFFYGQVGAGLSAVVAHYIHWADVKPDPALGRTIDRKIPPLLATGILFTSVSGLLNMLLILHVMDPRSWEGWVAPRPSRREP